MSNTIGKWGAKPAEQSIRIAADLARPKTRETAAIVAEISRREAERRLHVAVAKPVKWTPRIGWVRGPSVQFDQPARLVRSVGRLFGGRVIQNQSGLARTYKTVGGMKDSARSF